MKRRCETVKSGKAYKDYVLRNIKTCEEWHDFSTFQNWAFANGYTDELTIDRIDNNGNYCPENCCWITQEEQNRNKRNSIRIVFHEKNQSLKTLCEDLQSDYVKIKCQYQSGNAIIPLPEAQYKFLQ